MEAYPEQNGRYISHHALRAWLGVPLIFLGYTSIHRKIITVIPLIHIGIRNHAKHGPRNEGQIYRHDHRIRWKTPFKGKCYIYMSFIIWLNHSISFEHPSVLLFLLNHVVDHADWFLLYSRCLAVLQIKFDQFRIIVMWYKTGKYNMSTVIRYTMSFIWSDDRFEIRLLFNLRNLTLSFDEILLPPIIAWQILMSSPLWIAVGLYMEVYLLTNF